MTDDVMLIYLKTHHPYLHDIEMRVRKIQDQTGYGDVSAKLTIRSNKVVGCNIGEFFDLKYQEKMTV